MPRLHDGTEVSSHSEAWRMECEARWILKLPSLDERRAWLQGLEKRRGKTHVDQLKATMRHLWAQPRATATPASE
jgi:hypothetical protein